MHETYPAIVKKAKQEDAVIYWGDETGINNQAYHVAGFAPKGQTPTVPSFSKVEKIYSRAIKFAKSRCIAPIRYAIIRAYLMGGKSYGKY